MLTWAQIEYFLCIIISYTQAMDCITSMCIQKKSVFAFALPYFLVLKGICQHNHFNERWNYRHSIVLHTHVPTCVSKCSIRKKTKYSYVLLIFKKQIAASIAEDVFHFKKSFNNWGFVQWDLCKWIRKYSMQQLSDQNVCA